MSLRVLHPGYGSRIVDAGRPRSRALGVPVGGAADRSSFALGNALVGNDENAAALEVVLSGPRLRAEVELACVVVGAPFDLHADQDLRIGKTFVLPAGRTLQIAGSRSGLSAYLCVRGGFEGPLVLGSRSGLEPIRAGDVLACAPATIPVHYAPEPQPPPSDTCELRTLPGAQRTWFEAQDFLQQEYIVAPASNRMGLRLEGRPLVLPARELVSEPVAPGAVQVTRDGRCIILGVDGQTIGGYPKIAHVIRADLDLLGRLRPGSRVRFRDVTLDEAIALDQQARALLRARLLRVRLSLDGFGVARTLRDK